MSIDIEELRSVVATGAELPWLRTVTGITSDGHWIAAVYAPDRDLMVAAVNALPALLDEIERLRGLVREAHSVMTVNPETFAVGCVAHLCEWKEPTSKDSWPSFAAHVNALLETNEPR